MANAATELTHRLILPFSSWSAHRQQCVVSWVLTTSSSSEPAAAVNCQPGGVPLLADTARLALAGRLHGEEGEEETSRILPADQNQVIRDSGV